MDLFGMTRFVGGTSGVTGAVGAVGAAEVVFFSEGTVFASGFVSGAAAGTTAFAL